MKLHRTETRWEGEQLTIVEPDFLLDISAIAACFEGYGHHPLLYIANLMKPRPNTYHTLLGNFAGSALDDIINQPVYQLANTLRSNFREKALEYITCDDFNASRFKQDAARQAKNMQEITTALFTGNDDRQKALLEPSFVCPQLGIQGRVDLMTSDLRLLVEQKSGKTICPQKHYIQVLLYYGVLAANFGQKAADTHIHLLYSKFPMPDGLRHIDAHQYKRLFRQAIDFRNEVVTLLYNIAENGFGSVIDQLTPETLATYGSADPFFQRYERPRLEALLNPLHHLSPLERAYLDRMVTFVVREMIVSKTGGVNDYYCSHADLWRMPEEKKREMGCIYTRLTVSEQTQSSSFNGFDTITLNVPNQGEDFMPDFRRGDLVYLYAYPTNGKPDIQKAILYKGALSDIHSDQVTVHLNDGQQNADAFAGKQHTDVYYAIEHAGSDATRHAAIRSLHAFVTAQADRKTLLLAQRPPRCDKHYRLSRNYHPDYDDMLLHAFQAQDYFLLVGPPGTGKTSMALRFIVEEELSKQNPANPEDNGQEPALLLLAYTNRAVDEICNMLDKAGLDYLRLGNEYSCGTDYTGHLLHTAIEKAPTVEKLRQCVQQTTITVATTATMATRPYLLRIKQFSLAVVDEASQILEPDIIGLLADTNIGRFILIGDYKQLPAVVQQTEEDAAVNSTMLRAIHLDNCRNSLFQRLISTEKAAGREQFIGILHKQGRMHPEIAVFPSQTFYNHEQLQAVPLQHQQEEQLHYTGESTDDTDDLLKHHRLLFFPSKPCLRDDLSDKVNTDEARIVADLLHRLYRLMGTKFNPQQSVGVIVPYRNQIAVIRREIERLCIPPLNDISIDTVERYQGSQRDVIIYSFTVQKAYQLDFLTSNCFMENGQIIDRKLNVALTRARKQLILTGNEQTLNQNPLFRQLIEYIDKQQPSIPLQNRLSPKNTSAKEPKRHRQRK